MSAMAGEQQGAGGRARREVVVPAGAELLTVAQAAVLVQVCRTTVRGWCRSGKLRRYGEGRIWRVRRQELLALMERGGQPREDDVVAAILKKAGH